MATVFIVLRQSIIMFVYMAIGGLLFKKGLITKEGSKSLANLLLYAVLPCVVVKSFCVARTPERMSGLLVSFLAALGILLLAMAVSHLLFKKNPIDALDKETLFTIHKFFENNLNVSETSRKLFVHRNTLVYRLEKIKKLTGLDLRQFDHAIVFKVALMVRKYLTSRETR